MTKVYYFCGHEEFQPETLVQHAKLAEESGFDGVVVSEHFNPWVEDKGAAGFAFSTLGAIAQVTKTIDLMTGVAAPLFRYHPAVLAQAAATIDRLSAGRFSLGVGTGEAMNEEPLGYTFPPYVERARRLQEAITIMRGLLAGEEVSYDGEFYRVKQAKLYSPPLYRVPIFMAASGPKSAAAAGEYADGVIAIVKELERTRTDIFTPAKEAAGGKSYTYIAGRWSVFGETEEERWDAIQPWRGLRVPKDIVHPHERQANADAKTREEILNSFLQVESVAEYIEGYRSLIEQLGVDRVIVQTTSASRQEEVIKLLGKDVVPELQRMQFRK